jgi:hypothetical protein
MAGGWFASQRGAPVEPTEQSFGTERTTDVLDPAFVEGVAGAPFEEVRRRRDLAVVERDFQSYLRRLLQTRHDLLEGERRRRSSGEEPRSAVDRVKEALSDAPGTAPRTASRGEALRVRLSDDDLERAQAIASGLAPSSVLATPESMAEPDLADAVESLDRAERAVSANRGAVFRVHDRLQEELKRRYTEDPSLIPTDV